MSRLRRERTEHHVDREWPHQVRVAVGATSDTAGMDAWLAGRGGARRADGAHTLPFIRYCFRTPEEADRFQRVFPGERLDVLPVDPVVRTLRLRR
ncbi:hypothetical protein BN1110_05684 [bacterium YEK0313]|nr:hypothetical protein BN1110_05684 [bacterium YEK0313]